MHCGVFIHALVSAREHLLSLPLLHLSLADMPQLVHTRRLSSRNTLGQLHEATNRSPPRDSILSGASPYANDTDAWVLWAAVVLAVTEVADPSL